MPPQLCDPYEIGLLAALAGRLPERLLPLEARGKSAVVLAECLARENLRSVAYRYPDRRIEQGAHQSQPNRPPLLDADFVSLAGQSAAAFTEALRGDRPALGVVPGCAEALAEYVGYHSGERPGWAASLPGRLCRAVNRYPTKRESEARAAAHCLSVAERGFSDETWAKMSQVIPESLSRARIEAGAFFERAAEREQYPVYGYCIVDRDGSRGPLGVVADPKHCADITVRMNDSRDPAINGPYRMVELRAVQAHEHPPFGRDEHTLGYGIVSAERPLAQAEDGRTSGELIYESLAEMLDQVRLRNVTATGDLAASSGPWSAVELRAAPVDLERVHEFAQPDVADLDVATARGKVLGLRAGECPHVAGTLVAVAHKLRAIAIRESDGLLTSVVAPDGQSLANFKGLFGRANPALPAGGQLDELETAVRAATGAPVSFLMTAPDTCVASIAGVTHEGRADAPPIPWESVKTLRLGAGDHFMGEVLGVYHFPETRGADGSAYTAAVEMRLGHPLVRKEEFSPAPLLLVADMRTARWRRPDGSLHELGGAKPGDLLDVRMDESGTIIHLQRVERELGTQGEVRFAQAADATAHRDQSEGGRRGGGGAFRRGRTPTKVPGLRDRDSGR